VADVIYLYAESVRTNSPQHLSHGKSDQWDTTGVLLEESFATAPGRINFEQLFGNTQPLEIEIGTGKGTFLVARASARPELNFLGLEWARPYATYSADRFRRNGLTNVRMLRADAGPFFKDRLADQSVWRVHIYFPDPWPKRRHHRRRLIQPGFLQQVHRVLRPGGQLIVVTDHLDYFYQIRSVLHAARGFVTIPFPRMTSREGELVGTNFERKYIAQGRPFYWAARMKIDLLRF
jgi:tRNA (guanine-N7-)-methyltransferase